MWLHFQLLVDFKLAAAPLRGLAAAFLETDG